MPAESSSKIIAAADISSQPYSTAERAHCDPLTWLMRRRRRLERSSLAGRAGGSLGTTDSTAGRFQQTAALTRAALRSFSACIEGPDYTMRDEWDGSIQSRSMWGSSHDASEVGSVTNTVRGRDYASEYEGASNDGSEGGSVEGTVRDPHVPSEGDGQAVVPAEPSEAPEQPEPQENHEKPEREGHGTSPSPVNTPAPLILEAKWSPIRFGKTLPKLEPGEAEATCEGEDNDDEETDLSLSYGRPKRPKRTTSRRCLPLRIERHYLEEAPTDIIGEPLEHPTKRRRIFEGRHSAHVAQDASHANGNKIGRWSRMTAINARN